MSLFILLFCGDDTDCKKTKQGLSYTGKENYFGRCLFWKDADSSWPVMSKFDDKEFPDGSVDAAENYCRNPRDAYNPYRTGKFYTLWCFQRKFGRDKKVVPLVCNYPKLCRECQPKKVLYPGGKCALTDMVCCKRLLYMVGFLRPLQQLLGGQQFQQATVTLKFKMASNMAAIF